MINFNPGLTVGLAILHGLLIVPVLVVLSHSFLRINPAKKRFMAAIAFCLLAWIICIIIMFLTGYSISWAEVLSGIMILFTAIVAFGILWSLLCWGFTTSLLAALCKINRAASRDEWFQAYGGGSSIAGFADDRLSILLGLGIARIEGNSVMLSGNKGILLAFTVSVLRKFYGLPNG